jgi:ribulose-5-phosphate 4-epimerase/fuculose-1-phosphate aldolase
MHEEIIQTASRLSGKGLLNRAGDALSLRIPDQNQMLFIEAGELPRALELDNPGSGSAALHAQAYRLRQDAGAIASLSPRWSLQLQSLGEAMPGIFDEQARHLGHCWQPTDAKHLQAALAKGGNGGLVDGRLLILGVTRNRMLFNAELFEKCAMAYVLARLGGGKVKKLPWIVRYVAGNRLLKDEAKAALSHSKGMRSAEPSGY